MTMPALNRLMAARLRIADMAKPKTYSVDEKAAAQALCSELMDIANACIQAKAEYDVECERRG